MPAEPSDPIVPSVPTAAAAAPESDAPGAAAPAADVRPPFAWWTWFLIGAGGAIVGLLPWLVTGATLPLQNLWAVETLPDDMPRTLLPFSQYELVTVAALLGVGAAAAGIAFRALRARAAARSRFALVLGVLVVQLAAIVQTTVVVAAGLRDGTESGLYLGVVLGAAAIAFAAGLIVLPLIGWGPRAGALIGLALAAIVSTSWIGAAIDPVMLVTTDLSTWLLPVLRWVPPVLVGVAIAWCGLATVGRAIAAVVSLALLWVLPALITGVWNAFGSRVLLRYPDELVDQLVGVFRSALVQPELVLPPLVVAVVVAALGLALGAVLRGRRGGHPSAG
ncbi:hypothetical protein [Agromyces seonyuensis]|uniref:Uncharacterized protein n=1 Tax=Agromyces seonyuensis TaxID=2662446 RepID=A0A6I4P238_9MICO|nr:hypothetical protein [Agromyces seonyuensis]MWB98109.1 hypothetical protein [Agromyces seonyuensis]